MGKERPAVPNTTLGTISLVLSLLAGFALLPRLLARPQAPIVGRDAPDFHLAVIANAGALDGQPDVLSLGELRGRAVVLDFWATWCGPCRAEAPIVERVSRRWRDRDVVVVGINTDAAGEGDPTDFAARHGLSYPIVRDATGQASRSYDVDSLPTLVVVSRAGKVVAVRTGMTDEAELERLLSLAM